MREIKFRAWDKVNKEMHDIFTLKEVFKDGEFLDWDIEDCGIMQYTGLKDKNGKEIYEGDIVVVRDEETLPTKTIIKFMDAAFVLSDIKNQNRKLARIWDFENREVIGNIYENKEIIKDAYSK